MEASMRSIFENGPIEITGKKGYRTKSVDKNRHTH